MWLAEKKTTGGILTNDEHASDCLTEQICGILDNFVCILYFSDEPFPKLHIQSILTMAVHRRVFDLLSTTNIIYNQILIGYLLSSMANPLHCSRWIHTSASSRRVCILSSFFFLYFVGQYSCTCQYSRRRRTVCSSLVCKFYRQLLNQLSRLLLSKTHVDNVTCTIQFWCTLSSEDPEILSPSNYRRERINDV